MTAASVDIDAIQHSLREATGLDFGWPAAGLSTPAASSGTQSEVVPAG